MIIFYIILGGALGTAFRVLLSYFFDNAKFPYGTLLANISASFLLGFYIALVESDSDFIKNFLAFALTSSLSTFSAFALHLAVFIKQKQIKNCFLYLAATFFLCFAAFKIPYLF